MEAVKLTRSGRPQLEEGEVEVMLTDGVTVNRGPSGLLILTTRRVLWVGSGSGSGIHLKHAASVSTGRSLFRTTKIKLDFSDASKEQLVFRFDSDATELLTAWQRVLKEREWEAAAEAAAPGLGRRRGRDGAFSTRGAGIGGIMRRKEAERREEKSLTDDALRDLDSLMSKARDLVALASRYSSMEERKDGGDGSSKEDDDALGDMLLSIGIASPVTRASAGTLYHQQLARQLSDFLAAPLEKRGMMTLPDVYCVFNRARGTEWISPDDLHDAADLLAPLRLGMSLRTFASGVKVIQADSHHEDAVQKQIAEAVGDDGYLTVAKAAATLRVSLALAKQYLLNAEQAGLLCRDSSIAGLHFYRNRFV